MLKPARGVVAPFYRWGNNQSGGAALPELGRHPAWVYQHLDPQSSLPALHTHSHFLPFSHTCTRILTIHKTLHNTQGFYTPMHTGTFSHSCIHSHSHARAHTFTRTPLYCLTHMHPCTCTHTHSLILTLTHIATLTFTHSANTHILTVYTYTVSYVCTQKHVHICTPTCSYVPTRLTLSRHTHSCTRVLGSPPRAKFTPHLPRCPCCVITVALKCWWLSSGGWHFSHLRISEFRTDLPSLCEKPSAAPCGQPALVWSSSSVFSGSPLLTYLASSSPLPPYSNPSLDPLLDLSPHCAGPSCPLHQEHDVCHVQVMPSLHTTSFKSPFFTTPSNWGCILGPLLEREVSCSPPCHLCSWLPSEHLLE